MADPEARFYITAKDQTAAALRSAETGLKRIGTSVTQVRGAFRALGVALSARMLAGWVKDAIEVEKLSADQAIAIGNAGKAMTQLHGEFQALARTAVTELAPAIEHAAKWWRQFLFPTDQESAQDRIAEINEQVGNLARGIREIEAGRAAPGRQTLDQMKDQMRALGEEMQRVQGIANKPVDFAPVITQDEWVRLESFLYEMNNAKKDFSKGQKLSPELTQLIEDLQRGAELTATMRTETEKNIESLREYQTLLSTGAIDPETFTRLRDSLLEPVEVTAKRIKELKPEAEQWALSLGDGMKSAFAGFLSGAETNFRDFLKRLAAEWATSQIFAALSAGIGGSGATSGVAKFFGKIFGGFKADGGPVSSGKSYIVGERGPELFTPRSSGNITPNGGGPVTVTQHLHFDVGLESVDDRIRAAAGPISSATMGAIMKALNRPSIA